VSDDTVYRYLLHVVRVGDDQDGREHHDGTAKGAAEQLLREFQEARDRGYIVGDIRVRSRAVYTDPDDYLEPAMGQFEDSYRWMKM
jgi:hypothetical protein